MEPMSLFTLRSAPQPVQVRRLHNQLPKSALPERLGTCRGCRMRVFVDDDHVRIDGSLFHADCGAAMNRTTRWPWSKLRRAGPETKPRRQR